MRLIFKSLEHPEKHAYVFDSGAWNMKAQVSDHFEMYQTYGDGFTQHSPSWPITLEFMADYLASLATLMLTEDERQDDPICGRLNLDGPRPEMIAFAASVVFKESDRDYSKRRYYSVSEQKISSSRSKENDKRYFEIADWCDGKMGAIYRMLIPEYASGLQRYAYARAIRSWICDQPKMYCDQSVCNFLNWFSGATEREMQDELRYAFDACASLVKAYYARRAARGELQNIQNNRDRAAKHAAEKAAAAAATDAA